LEAAQKLKIENLIVYGDAESIVKHIRQQNQAKHPRIRLYKNCSWDLIEKIFSSFNIHHIPRAKNQQVDSLVKAVATFMPPTVLKLKYHIEMRHGPSIPKNVQRLQVFEDDEQIKQFLEMVDEFSKTHIDQENQNDPTWIMQEDEDPQKFQDKITNHCMLVSKNNQIPKGLIPLERLFDKDDMSLKSTLQPQLEEVEDRDIGTKENPKLVKISKYLPPEMKIKYVKLLKQYKYVFTSSYDELRTYDTTVIEHKIPLKPGIKPFRKNLK
jgi:hypothetical protein